MNDLSKPSISNVSSGSRERREVMINEAKLNKRSIGAEDGRIQFVFKNTRLTLGNLARLKMSLDESSKN